MDQEVQKRIWDREQVARMRDGDGNNRRRLAYILSKINRVSVGGPRKDIRVLNIGIGNGRFEEMLQAAGYAAYSLDPSENAVEAMAKKHDAFDRFKVGSSSSIPFPDKFFAFVVMSEIIEHLNDATLAATLGEVNRVMTPGGTFIGTCPDNEDVVAKTHTCPHCGGRFHRVGHVRSFTKHSLRKLLSTNFDVKECHSFRGMHLNWKGLAMYWYQSLPYRIAGFVKPSVSVPQSMGQHLFFMATHGGA